MLHPALLAGVIERGQHCGRERVGAVRVGEDGHPVGDLMQHRNITANNRDAAGHRLEHRKAEALGARRNHHGCGAAVDVRHGIVGQMSGQHDRAGR